MPETTQKRQLAAIMFTDIVGYTALMGVEVVM
jgi:class 3 adenylate cyclase